MTCSYGQALLLLRVSLEASSFADRVVVASAQQNLSFHSIVEGSVRRPTATAGGGSFAIDSYVLGSVSVNNAPTWAFLRTHLGCFLLCASIVGEILRVSGGSLFRPIYREWSL